MTQEFHVSVTPIGPEQYLVRTEWVAQGVPLAEEQVGWPVSQWLQQARRLMNDPLLGLLEGGGATSTLLDLGYELYGALFQGTLRDSWLKAQGIAQHRQEVLRLRLGLKDRQLLQLPWEVMCGSDRTNRGGILRPIATGTDVVFSRYQPGVGMVYAPSRNRATTVDVPPELRILMVIASPSDRERLALKDEAQHLQQELLVNGDTDPSLPHISVTILEQPGREELTQALEQGEFQVLHYAGHSDPGESGGSLYLVNTRNGLTESLSGNDLAGLLANNGIRMAVFNSCRGAYTAADTPAESGERNLAEALVRQGIPAVLAMAERIPDDVALTLTRLFYRNLKQGYPVDLSLSRARQGLISAYGSNQLYWALPTLYLHSEFDGYLATGDRALDNPADDLMQQAYGLALDPLTENMPPSLDEMLPELELDIDPTYEDRNGDAIAHLVEELSGSGATESLSDPSGEPLSSMSDSLNDGEAFAESDLDLDLDLDLDTDTNTDIDVDESEPIGESSVEPTAKPERTASTGSSSNHIAKSPRSHPRLKSPSWINIASVIVLSGVVSYGLIKGFQYVSTGTTSVQPVQADSVDLPNEDTNTLVAIAISRFNQGDISTGQQALEVLLDRGALTEATTALSSMPSSQDDSAVLQFLRGRLIWQRYQSGEDGLELADIRNYWEAAVAGEPDSTVYLNALGFIYYVDGDLEEALAVWGRSLDISSHQSTLEQGLPTTTTSDVLTDEMLTAYAGMALALLEQAENADPQEQATLRSKAQKIHAMVIAQAPTRFSFEALGTNWQWDTRAIEQWRLLSRTGQQQANR